MATQLHLLKVKFFPQISYAAHTIAPLANKVAHEVQKAFYKLAKAILGIGGTPNMERLLMACNLSWKHDQHLLKA